jgi:hypothetical protein
MRTILVFSEQRKEREREREEQMFVSLQKKRRIKKKGS